MLLMTAISGRPNTFFKSPFHGVCMGANPDQAEREGTWTMTAPADGSVLDAEDELYEALGALQECRNTDDREALLQAQADALRAVFILQDNIESTAPES